MVEVCFVVNNVDPVHTKGFQNDLFKFENKVKKKKKKVNKWGFDWHIHRVALPPCYLVELQFGNVGLFLEEGKPNNPREKPLERGIRPWVITLVTGSHCCTTVKRILFNMTELTFLESL